MARGTQCWLNGKILPVENAKISLFTHGLHYGLGAFEGIRAYKQKKGGGAVFRLAEHLQRLYDSCKILDLKIPYTMDELMKATIATCKANGFEECYIRPIAYTADGPLGVHPGANPALDIAILNWEWGSYLGDKGINEGARLKVSSFIRPHVASSMTKGKITGQYVNGVMAKREAVAAGYDEALMLDTEGFLTEGTGENLFMVKDGVIKTTPLTSILNGITRQTVMEYLKNKGYTITETRFTRDELWCADEVFLTGTAAEVTPVREIDSRLIGNGPTAGKPGPITARVQKDYAAIVRGDLPEYGRNWLTPIV
ncbi:MAG: branched chain amino acid aminotransferase [Bdellovibrionales bacterium RIFOXYC1_FULL_54_43]|nr:MAG: branched chain amino acid aminotransferase [Bdellovibrionales bacterium RIFOXYC1_FULL_54_43]OFZ79039.1 MAG: branched chain amino acid aminotransferase [Bdellovibrionales bacterium RIFOXYD1_FULL_55_31]